MTDQPAVGMLEQHARTISAGPAQGAQPAPEPKLHAAVGELAIAVASADLCRVPPALLAVAVGENAIRGNNTELRR